MEPYTIEDIELLRKKSGMSYQEAVALLDYHNGNLARALIDLEKNGRLKDESQGKESERTMSNSEKRSENKTKALNLLQKLYRTRVKIHKGNTPVINLSVLFGAACLLFAPHMTIIGVIISMILGYKFSFSRMDEEFSTESLEKMVKSAAQNAKSSVASVVQTISDETRNFSNKDKKAETDARKNEKPVSEPEATRTSAADVDDAAEALRKQTKEIEETMDSFFDSNPAATTYRSAYSAAASSVPTIQVPVQAETRDGEVEINDDQDGYSSVTIG